MTFWQLLSGLLLIQSVFAATRTTPPSGALIVRTGTTTSGEYKTVQAAIDALADDGSTKTIFIYPGTYSEQVYIDRDGPIVIYGYTNDTTSYSTNQVIITAKADLVSAGSNDATGTLRIHSDDVSLYNVNLRNTYGPGSQAGAISEYGNHAGFYACSFIGYQDTLYANAGTQVYLRSYIEGAVDFIYGKGGLAYFGKNTIAVNGPGCITASGRTTNDSGSYVFEGNSIVLASGAASGTSKAIYLGRPWVDYAKVIFKNTVVTAPLNSALWKIWNTGDPRTDHVTFADYNSTGTGVAGASRPSFATLLTASQAATYSISSAVGSDYASWVDATYL